MKNPIKKLIGAAVLAGGALYLYDKYQKKEQLIEVREISATDIIDMLKERGFSITKSNDQILTFLNEDQSEALQIILKDDEKKISYMNQEQEISQLTPISDSKTNNAFRNLLGSIGVTETRFDKLIDELFENEDLIELSIR